MVGNAGIGKEHDSKTEDRKIQEFYQVWCLIWSIGMRRV
jgi:hypothetical protein